jgi:electron transfer flavoprotein alpha subunit
MAQLFAYIAHKQGVLDDSAAELAVAAAKIAAGEPVTAIVTGSGPDLDTACQAAAAIYPAVWKFDNAELAYPNAEIVRKLLVKVLPADGIVLIPHDTFGMDLGPGLSIKLESAYAADIIGIDSADGGTAILVRQEYAGMAHAHVSCDISNGAVMSIRPGSFQAPEANAAGGQVEDKSGEVGDIASNRRFLEVVEAEVGDVDITKSDVLVSVGRGIEDEENIEIAEELAEAMGAVVSCSRPIVDAKWLEKIPPGGHLGTDRQAQGLHGVGHQRLISNISVVSRAHPLSSPSTKIPRPPSFRWPTWASSKTSSSSCPKLTEKIQEG